MTGQSAAIGVAELIVVIYRFNSRRDINSTVLDLSFADVQGSQLVALFVVVEAGEFIAP